MRKMSYAGAGALGLGLIAAATGGAAAESFTLEGSLQAVGALTFNYQNPVLFADHERDGISRTVLRLMAAGRPSERFSYELHGGLTATYDTYASTSLGEVILGGDAASSPSHGVDVSWEAIDQNGFRAGLDLYRANLRAAFPLADLIVGRQAINYSRAWFWNPLDLFLSPAPWSFNRSYRTGVDAARLEVPLGSFSGLTFLGVAAAGRTDGPISWGGSSLLLRGFTARDGWDGSILCGKVRAGSFAGAGLGVDVGGTGLGVQAARLWADTGAPAQAVDHAEVAISATRRLNGALIVEAEYFYNGAGAPHDLGLGLQRQLGGYSRQMGRHFLGALATYQFSALLRSDTAWIQSLTDGSCLLQTGVSLSVSAEADLLLGVIAPLGRHPEEATIRSEFGAYPSLLYAELKYSF